MLFLILFLFSFVNKLSSLQQLPQRDQILVSLAPVDLMQCVKNEMVPEHVIACPVMRATLMKVVATNVNSIPIVHHVLPVFKINASTHVLAHVAFMRYAM